MKLEVERCKPLWRGAGDHIAPRILPGQPYTVNSFQRFLIRVCWSPSGKTLPILSHLLSLGSHRGHHVMAFGRMPHQPADVWNPPPGIDLVGNALA